MQAITTSIKISSRASVKVKDSYYTVEYTEERSVPNDLDETELEDEREELWALCNDEVDKQLADILQAYGK